MNWLETWNRHLFLAWNAGAGASPLAIAAASLIAQALIYAVPAVLVAQWLWGAQRHRKASVEAVLVTLLALGMNQLIILAWPHPRPFMDGLGHQWLAHAADPSFPSDHMTVFSSVGLTFLLASLWATGGVLLLAAAAVAWARVFLGVHYPLDMAGGLAVSAVALALFHPVYGRLQVSLLGPAQGLYRRLFARLIGYGWVRP